jgi:hypothetical protein
MTIIDDLGFASAKAQNLRAPITTLMKLRSNPDQRVYIMREEIQSKKSNTGDFYYFASGGLAGFKDLVNTEKYEIVGMVKVGIKTLFVVVLSY